MWSTLADILIILLVWRLALKTRSFKLNAQKVAHIPGYKVFIDPYTLIACVLPRFPYFNMGEQMAMRYKFELFSKIGSSGIISIVSFINASYSIFVRDPVSIRFITSERNLFIKPLILYDILAAFGPNLDTLDGSEWARHKRILMNSTFFKNMDKLAYQHTLPIIESALSEWKLEHPSGFATDDLAKIMLKFAFSVLVSAGFGRNVLHNDEGPDSLPPGHKVSFRQSFHGVLDNIFTKKVAPSWIYRFPFQRKFSLVALYFDEFDRYLTQMIKERRDLGVETLQEGSQIDLLGALVGARSRNDTSDAGEGQMSDSEIKGNLFLTMFAGHDTSAVAMTFTLALLAIYSEEQEKICEHINRAVQPGQAIAFEDLDNLDLVTAAFMETLRLFPPAVTIPKVCMANTPVPTQDEEVLIPKYTLVFLDAPGLHYDPSIWGDDAAEYRPSRFIDTDTYKWPRHGFFSFSSGPRACIGPKFAKVEATLILASILRDYKITLQTPRRMNESRLQYQQRIVKAVVHIALKPAAEIAVLLVPRM